MIDPRFSYEDISKTGLSTKKLDELMAFVMGGAQAGTWGAIVSGLKLLVVAGYVYARKQIAGAELEKRKQEYEQSQGQGSQDQVSGDNLGSEPRG